ncbi:MAG: ABC transporter permease subunit [Saprospiraceae bacterium]
MISYIIKRISLFIPTLLLVSCIAFGISKIAPTDPINAMLALQGVEPASESFDKEYNNIYIDLKFDLPAFYFTIKPSYKRNSRVLTSSKAERRYANMMLDQMYPQQYINETIKKINKNNTLITQNLYNSSSVEQIILKLKHIETLTSTNKKELLNVFSTKASKKSLWHYPTFKWNGVNNQYHLWLGKIITGNFGVSYLDGKPVTKKIASALKWSFTFVLVSIIFVFIISFPLGIYNGINSNGKFDNWTSSLFFFLYSIPKFWLATLMIIFFTTVEYGNWTNIFPSVGIWYQSVDQGFLEMLSSSWPKLILPVFVMIIPDIAYLSRMIRSSVKQEISKEYIKTAKAKGLSTWQIAKKHIIPNASAPTITLLAGSLPSAISSSLIIEVIFNIPGIGRLMYDSIINADWATVFPVILIISVLTVIAFLIADIMIAVLNPKVKLG